MGEGQEEVVSYIIGYYFNIYSSIDIISNFFLLCIELIKFCFFLVKGL